jgi:quinoprotein glucose dehydrogenase
VVSDTEWRYYAADQASTRYAPLDQINADNFSDLEIAWRFKPDAIGSRREYQFEATPLLIKGRRFLTAGARPAHRPGSAVAEATLWAHHGDQPGDRRFPLADRAPVVTAMSGRCVRKPS